mgnify:CR=1 FL=1
MYQRIIKPVLFSLTIERAHRAVLLLLRCIGLIPGGRWLLRKCYAEAHPSLEREVFGIRFPNPVGLAAGFDRNGEAIRELSALGFGFVEIGTVTPRPQGGNPRPRVFRLPRDRAIINRIGLSNHGLEAMIRHLQRNRGKGIVGCNIGKNTDTPPENAAADYLKAFRSLYQYADYFTVNISCDNSCREEFSHTPEHILQILGPLFDFRRGQSEYRPIMLKISPDLSDEEIDRITDVMTSSPLDGIVATNGTHLRQGLQTSPEAIETIGSGRLSGAPLTRRTIEIVRRIHTRSGGTYPIIGVGGLMTPGRRPGHARRRGRPRAALHGIHLRRAETRPRNLPGADRRRRQGPRTGLRDAGRRTGPASRRARPRGIGQRRRGGRKRSPTRRNPARTPPPTHNPS